MEISVLVLVAIALSAMFFGYFFGLLEGRGQGYKRRRKEEITEHEVPPPPPPVSAPRAKVEQRQALLELRLTDAGRPQLQMDGREVDPLRVSPEQRRRIIDLMVMLKPWVEPGTPATPPPAGAISREPAPVVRQTAVSAKPAAELGAPAPPPAAPSAPVTQMSLVAQIDSILQARLVGTPLAARGIRLAESLHGGAIVFVGSNQYDGVDRVPDPEIQAAIRGAITEWENKYTPG
jgi:hypothetical protein